jgi:hypothetical protein
MEKKKKKKNGEEWRRRMEKKNGEEEEKWRRRSEEWRRGRVIGEEQEYIRLCGWVCEQKKKKSLEEAKKCVL